MKIKSGLFIIIFFFIGVVMLGMLTTTASIAALAGGAEEEEYKQKQQTADENLQGQWQVSSEVLALKNEILEELKKYHKEEYIGLYLAVVQQESGGNGEDVFQCSESLGKPPNSLSKEESIKQGVKYLSGMLDSAGVTSPTDIEHIKIALQAYNFGGGFIEFIKKNGGKWTQRLTYKYASIQCDGEENPPPRDEQLGPWRYGDQYYTQHVLRYYQTDSEGNMDTGEVTGIAEKDRLAFLFPSGVPTSAGEMEKYLTTITVPVCDTKGNVTNINIRCHKKVANLMKSCFEEMAEIKFPVQYSGCYVWRPMRGGTSQSHHSYGSAIDINAKANAQYTHGDKNSPYYINQKVVKIWKNHGFFWGGDWDEKHVDPMHFTFANR